MPCTGSFTRSRHTASTKDAITCTRRQTSDIHPYKIPHQLVPPYLEPFKPFHLFVTVHCDLAQRRAGAKGFGLFAVEDINAGQFIIQYVGEVLEEEEYMRRKIYYQNTGQRHYYFMNIGNGEVIDACRKV